MNGDGRLTAELFPGEKPQEECGVFGVYAPGLPVSQLAYYGLYSLQHRGQEAAGIAATSGDTIYVYKDVGLVSQVFNDENLATLQGHQAIGHVRYATTGQSVWENAQPTLGPTQFGTVAIAHNGNLTNTAELMAQVREASGTDLRGELGRGSSTDTAVLTALFTLETQAQDLEEATLSILPRLEGAFSLAFMDENTLYAARDPRGFRPLVLGKISAANAAGAAETEGSATPELGPLSEGEGYVVASETAALDIIGARFIREVTPGELLIINTEGVRSHIFAPSRPSGCIFEYVYLARPDTAIAGRSINTARLEMGRALAREYPVDADLVIATPDSGTPAAIGYAQESGIPFGQGLVKNAYVGRTFIQPTQLARQRGIRLKLNPMREVIEGRRLVVVDDSIVRGNTQRALIKMLREAGAREVHVRISSPPVRWPCFFGIDFPTRRELIANGMAIEEICASLGADSLGYISLDGMVAATGQDASHLCMACFSGDYQVDVRSAAATSGSDLLDVLPVVPLEDVERA